MVMGEQTLKTQVAVIGGGPAGYAAAFRAADLGLEVTLINAEAQLGGVCLLRGCIPSKALHRATSLIAIARDAEESGIHYQEPQVDLEGMRSWIEGIISSLARGLAYLAKQRDVQVVQARAVFESSTQLRLQGAEVAHVAFEHAILATGGHPSALPGLVFEEGRRVMSPGMAVQLPVSAVPETLLVVGGGYNGVEIASRYALLGSQVTLVEMLDRLLPNAADPELVKPLATQLKKLLKAIHLETALAAWEEQEDGIRVTFEGQIEKQAQTFDRMLVAVGTEPNSNEIGLENTNIRVDDKGFVQVDEQQRTDDPHIFAAGDVVGGALLAHKAMYEGKIAAEVIAGKPAAFDARCIPAVIYTDPEIAWCGLTEEDARSQGLDIRVGRFPWSASSRARTFGTHRGLTKIVFDAETARVLGVGIVGPGAENLIAEGALAIEMGAVAQDLAWTVHPHPTLSETISEAAEAFLGVPIDILPEK
ncbi:MAG: dihydrolipoyl dehydrogenase [Anaerolineae bacterium]|nr:dihydrolipoyl dehydrogenase [Anaerolineae bacterium]